MSIKDQDSTLSLGIAPATALVQKVERGLNDLSPAMSQRDRIQALGYALDTTGASLVPVTVIATVVVEPSFRLTVKVSVTT